MKSDIRHFRDLKVYQRAFIAAVKIYELTKSFPLEELDDEYEQILAMLNSMEMNADKFCF